MSKRNIVYLICGLAIIAITIIIIMILLSTKRHLPKQGSLYVNGKEIADVDITIYKNYAEIPLIEMLKGLGFEVNWTLDTTAEFICNNEKYIIDLDEVSVKKEDTIDNLLIPAPGNTIYICKESNNDIVLDDISAINIMFFLKNEIFIQIDYEKSAVYVVEK